LDALHKDAQRFLAKGLNPRVLNLKLKELESKKHLPAVGISDDGSIKAIKDFPEKHSMRIVETGPQNYTTVDDGTDDKTLPCKGRPAERCEAARSAGWHHGLSYFEA